MEKTENNGSALETVKVVLTLITILSAIHFLAKIFGKDEDEENEAKANESRRKLYGKIPPSYATFVYKDWADSLDTALMKQAGEDEDSVYAIFAQMKNISDVNELISAFGHKRQMFSTLYLSLPQAITVYFNASEKKKLNGILSKKGIAYTFN